MPRPLTVQDIKVQIGQQTVLQNLSLQIEEGEFFGIIGPNGSGKTSLLKTLLGFLPPVEGQVWVYQQPLATMPALQRAQTMACVQQDGSELLGFKVKTYLELAYYPQRQSVAWAAWQEDRQRLCQQFKLQAYFDRPLSELSGGEKQRVLLVQSLLQNPKILLLDELTNHLDIYYQLEFLQILRVLPLTKVMVLHDINLAARFCDRILMLKEGRALGYGRPSDILNEQSIQALYGVSSRIHRQGAQLSYIEFGV